MNNSLRTIKIEIVSDVICPWCYVGKKKLDIATKGYPKAKFDISWSPYTLDPNLPVEGINKFEYWLSKGSKEALYASFPPTTAAGNSVGIAFKYGGDVANTLRSHQLSEYARKKGKQNEVMNELFADYHENEKNIGSIEVLAAAAGRAGLDEEEVKHVLKDNTEKSTVEKEAREVRAKYGANGVPFFVIDEQYGISGARDASTFHKIFDKVLNEQ